MSAHHKQKKAMKDKNNEKHTIVVKSTNLKSKLNTGLNLYCTIVYHGHSCERILNIRMNRHKGLILWNCVYSGRTLGCRFR